MLLRWDLRRARNGTLAIERASVGTGIRCEHCRVEDDVVLGLFTSSGAASVWNLQRAFSVASTRASHLGPTCTIRPSTEVASDLQRAH